MSRALRIAFVGQKGFPAHWGGVEAHVDAVARRLAERGHEVTVYVRRWYSPAGSQRVEGVRAVALPTIHTKHLDASVHSALSAVAACVQSVDLVHFHCMGPALFSPLPRLMGRPVVTTLHALDFEGPKWGRVARGALRAGERIATASSHRLIAVSRGLAERYRERGIACEHIANGVDVPEAPGQPASERPYLLALGRWAEGKGMIAAIEGFRAQAPSDMNLVVAGAATEPAMERAVRAAARGDSRVHFPGYVTGDDKARLLAGASGFVTASTHEGLPIALLEALAVGLPCAASDIPAHREAFEGLSGETLFRPGEEERGIAALIARSALDTAEGRARRRAYVANNYSWERSVDQLEAVYRDVISARSVR